MRNGFLCLMAPELVPVSGQHIDTLDRPGAAGSARPGWCAASRLLGAALSEMRHAPDPRVLLDVAAVQLTADSVAPDLGALARSPAPPRGAGCRRRDGRRPQVSRRRRRPPVTRHGSSGARRARPDGPAATPSTGQPAPHRRPPRSRPSSGRPVTGHRAAAPSPSSVGHRRSRRPLCRLTRSRPTSGSRRCVRRLRGMTRAVYAPATLVRAADGAVTFSLPNVAHREKCEQHRDAVEAAIRTATGTVGRRASCSSEGESSERRRRRCRPPPRPLTAAAARVERSTRPRRPMRRRPDPVASAAAPIGRSTGRRRCRPRRSRRRAARDRQVADRSARRGLSGLRVDRRSGT